MIRERASVFRYMYIVLLVISCTQQKYFVNKEQSVYREGANCQNIYKEQILQKVLQQIYN